MSAQGWPKQSPPQAQPKEQSLVLRLKGLSEQQNIQAKPQERKEAAVVAQWRPTPPPQPERTHGEGLREVNDAPLDLSDRGSRSKSNKSPKDDEPILLSEGEREEGQASDRDAKTRSPCMLASSQQQEHNTTSDYKVMSLNMTNVVALF